MPDAPLKMKLAAISSSLIITLYSPGARITEDVNVAPLKSASEMSINKLEAL